MAGLTFVPALAVVNILKPVTGYASGWQILVDFPGMTQLAADFLVGVNKWKFGLFMIEGFGVTPVVHTVTGIAFLTETTFMRLILLVAIRTVAWGIPEFGFRLVTGIACERLVRAGQRKVREMMVERFWIESVSVGIPANMICVAMLAIGLGDVLAQAMKADSLLHVGVDPLMAIAAQTRL